MQHRVGDDPAQHAFSGSAQLARRRCRQHARRLGGQRCDGILIARHQLLYRAVGGEYGKVGLQWDRGAACADGLALHNDLLGRFARHLARARIHLEQHLGQHRAVLAGAGEQERLGGIHALVVAQIGLVRVAGDHHIDLGGESIQYRQDIA